MFLMIRAYRGRRNGEMELDEGESNDSRKKKPYCKRARLGLLFFGLLFLNKK